MRSTFVLLILACGGGTPPDNPKPVGTDSTSTATTAGTGPTTTTTTALGDGGDLQGAKLQQTSGGSFQGQASDAGPAASSGTHDPGRAASDIQTIILTRRDEARACYDNALKAHPGIEGNLDIKWTIDPSGAVTDIAVDDSKSEIHEASCAKCIMDLIKKIKFAASPRGLETRTHYPYNFHPRMPIKPPG